MHLEIDTAVPRRAPSLESNNGSRSPNLIPYHSRVGAQAQADRSTEPKRMRVLTIYAHHDPRSFCHHEYFYAVHGADDATRRGYLERAYSLGREF